jgi:ParB-like chromosome segregation protein Spo0J
MKTEWIALDAIETGDSRRPVDAAHVNRLVASIKEIGLQTPITVMARSDDDGWRYILVAGAHRLAALRQSGEDGAECFILADDQDAADLWEIDENFARSELTDAQRADHHVRREAILVRRGEVQTNGGDRRSGGQNVHLKSYAKKAAADLGVDERTIRRDLARGKKIAPDVLADVAGTDLDKGIVLDELAATPRDEQRDKLAEIEHRRSVVRMAPDPLNDPEAHEKQLAALMSAWNRAAAVVRQEFLLRVEGPVFDRGAA